MHRTINAQLQAKVEGNIAAHIKMREENNLSSTNKTTNLKLNQWVLSDPFNMEDFNADNLKIENAMTNIPVKKLAEVTLNATASTVELDLSGIDLSKYATLRVYQRSGVNNLYMRVNGYTSYLYWYNLNWQTDSSYCYDGGLGYFDIELAASNLFIHTAYRLTRPGMSILPSALTKLNMICLPSDPTVLYPIGTKFILMGVMK